MSELAAYRSTVSPYPAGTSLGLHQTHHDTLHIVNTEDDNASHLPDETKNAVFRQLFDSV